MRVLALVFVLLLGLPAVTAKTALAQTGVEPPQVSMEDMRGTVRGALNQARQFLGGLLTQAKETAGLDDEQLFGVGVGLLTGLLVADVVGSGGFGMVFFAGAGALFGKWVTSGSR